MTVPRVVLLVPYRNRPRQYQFFRQHMAHVLSGTSYELWFIHQADRRPFNRGALKNLGFLFVRNRYPDHYREITLVFHDVDTLPIVPGVFDYETLPGVVKHFYGFQHVLGGIVSFRGADFERAGGFPNYWTWGFEDNMMQLRAVLAGLQIDRSTFYPTNEPAESMHVIHLNNDGMRRTVHGEQAARFAQFREGDTWRDVRDVRWLVDAPNQFVHVLRFEVATPAPTDAVELDITHDPHLVKLMQHARFKTT